MFSPIWRLGTKKIRTVEEIFREKSILKDDYTSIYKNQLLQLGTIVHCRLISAKVLNGIDVFDTVHAFRRKYVCYNCYVHHELTPIRRAHAHTRSHIEPSIFVSLCELRTDRERKNPNGVDSHRIDSLISPTQQYTTPISTWMMDGMRINIEVL